jgi:serine/threonine-protein kinase
VLKSTEAGDRLGPYELLAKLGEGGMGEVWKARDTRLDRLVAIKRCKHEFSDRFLREARAVAALNHPNICTLHDVGPDYLVMEYIEGAPPRGPLPPSEALPLAIGIASALEAAHSRGITHRDLKPANILVTATGVKLLDFGLASIAEPAETTQVATALTAVGAVVGTVAYMSPEQATGQPVDSRSDIFSFGLVLYELLSGRQAFGGRSAIETLAAIVRDDPPPVAAPPLLAAVVARCLRKAPADRYQSMTDVRAALEDARRGGDSGTRALLAPVDRPSIAVLPFANLSADKENEYFSDGLAEEILNLLARIPGLRVIARTSSFAFRGRDMDIARIAEALHVGHILEGSVRKAANRIRVSVQLVSASDGTQIWSERFDRDMTDVFAIQDEIAQAVSSALHVRLAPPARAFNIEAYQHHLRGRFHLLHLTKESLAKARECYEQALAVDPEYAPAHSALAEYYHTLLLLDLEPALDMAPLARAAAERALTIDPAHGEAHSTLGSIAGSVDYLWDVAGEHHRRAVAIEPVSSIIRFRYAAWYLLPLGRIPEARQQLRLGLETDPLHLPLHYAQVLAANHEAKYADAIEFGRRALEIDPAMYPVQLSIAQAQLRLGQVTDAIRNLERTVEIAPWMPMAVGTLAAAYHVVGEDRQSRALAAKLADRPGHAFASSVYHAATGDSDAMFADLERAFRQRDAFLIHIALLPFVDRYHGDPRYRALLERMHLARN